MERIAELSELPPGGRRSIYVDDTPALLLRIGDDVFAIEDVCTHDGQPLTSGDVIDGQIVCPRHGARFDLRTGAAKCMPATSPIATFDVEIKEGGIYVGPRGSVSSTEAARVPATTSIVPPSTTAPAPSAPAASQDDADLDDGAIIEALRQVIDPELMINIIDLGLVYTVNRNEQRVLVEMTLTSPACPAGPQIVQQSKNVIERLPGVQDVQIKLVMSPPWTPERMTDEARDQLGFF